MTEQQTSQPITESIKKIIILDDAVAETVAQFIRYFLPDADIRTFEHTGDVIEVLEEGYTPDLFITDCRAGGLNDWGHRNAEEIIQWFQTNATEEDIPVILFESADEEMATSAAKAIKNRYGDRVTTYGHHSWEMNLAKELQRNETPRHKKVESTGFREFLRDVCGITLPITAAEINEYMLERDNYRPQDIVDMVSDGTLERDDAMHMLSSDILAASETQYIPRVKIKNREEQTRLHSCVSAFSQSAGQTTQGYAAFSKADVDALSKEGKKAILFLDKYTTRFFPYVDKLAGIVLVNGETPGHMKILLGAHNLAGALGAKNLSWDYPFLRTPARKEIPQEQIIKGAGRNRAFIDFGNAISQIGQDYIARHQDDQETVDPFYLPNLTVDIEEIEPKSKIKFGNPVTIDIAPNGIAKLYPEHVEISTNQHHENAWLGKIDLWLDDWHSETSHNSPKFKSNIDHSEQSVGPSSGIGLARTEHFVLSSTDQLDDFKSGVLQKDELAFERLQEAMTRDMIDIMYPVRQNSPVRIRLIDLPSNEVAYTKREKSTLRNLYGDETIRGIQLAEQIPTLYENQIRAIFQAVEEGYQQECKVYEEFPTTILKAKPEIMVPTVRNADELRLIKEITSRIAAEYGFEEGDYRFGSMLETVEACKNIEEIAKECDFISIGSNDLTEEVLSCPRGDLDARHKTMRAAKTEMRDPFIRLYEPVVDVISDAVSRARKVNPEIEVDFCGDHATDLESLERLRDLDLNSVSVAPTDQNLLALKRMYMFNTFKQFSGTNPQPDLINDRRLDA